MRIRKNGKGALLAAAAAVVSIAMCTDLSMYSGTITQSGNGIVSGRVVSSGIPVAGARVLLLSGTFNPVSDPAIPDSLAVTTNAAGDFRIVAPGRKVYNIEVLDVSGKNALVSGIPLPDDDSTITISLTLTVPGTIVVEAPSLPNTETCYFFVPGTTLCGWMTGGGIVIPGVPAGIISAVCAASTERPSELRVVKTGIPVTSGGTSVVTDYQSWKHSRKIYLNTSATGAGVAADVHHFPVAIRLTGSNFNFSEALRNGADVRFSKADNAPLSYEVESWDSAGQHAALWVKVDTVLGNNSTQSIVMHWGSPNAKNASDGTLVFGPRQGFAAVLHFGQDCRDASGNGYHGVNYGASDTTGMIGFSKQFDGNDSIKIEGLLGKPRNITLSAWARLDAPDSIGAEVISLGDDVSIRLDDISDSNNAGTWGAFRYDSTFMGFAAADAKQSLGKTGWHLLSFTIDSDAGVQTFYIDGAVAAVTSVKKQVYYHQGRNTYIGRHGYNWFGPMRYNFTGTIDEVRLCSVARSPEWARLCFMNQKPVDVLTIFGP